MQEKNLPLKSCEVLVKASNLLWEAEEWPTSYVQTNSVGVIKLRILKWGACPGFVGVLLQGILIEKKLSSWAQCNHKDCYKGKREAGESERQM